MHPERKPILLTTHLIAVSSVEAHNPGSRGELPVDQHLDLDGSGAAVGWPGHRPAPVNQDHVVPRLDRHRAVARSLAVAATCEGVNLKKRKDIKL